MVGKFSIENEKCKILSFLYFYARFICYLSSDDRFAFVPVNTLMLGKPEKGRMVESMLLRMAQTGQIMGKLGENELINLLESINQQTSRTTTVKVRITVSVVSFISLKSVGIA